MQMGPIPAFNADKMGHWDVMVREIIVKGLGRISYAGGLASEVCRTLQRCMAVMLLPLLLLLPTTAQAAEKRNFVAVIVDDSKSMSYYKEVGSDPAGLAAFAASQLPRFVPDGTTLGIFTFDSTATKNQQTREAKVAQPLHVIKNINDSVRQRSFDILSASLLKQNPEGFHPYGFGGTPCRDALIAASEWLATETGTDDAIARTVLFLSDGVCDGDQALKQSLVYNSYHFYI